MTDIEISTLVKAAYVIVAAEGQTNSNLIRVSNAFVNIIPNFDPFKHIRTGEEMSMKQMVKQLSSFSKPIDKTSLDVLSTLSEHYRVPKAIALLNEIREILRTSTYSDIYMPELSLRISVEENLFG